MIDINIVNFLTIGIISLAAWALFKWASAYFGINTSWAA
jgi:hypothetical protein